MSVKVDASGRRWVEVETEVPGTPEEVWEAIATGAGVSSWFVPTELREDGTIVSHFGPGMDAIARQTAWDPPRRFAGEGEGFGPNAPPLATEWTVEAKSGGTCIVRVVHSLFASTDDWDDQLENIEGGWPDFFRILWLYLAHFRGQHASTLQLVRVVPEPAAKAWAALSGPLGLDGASAGEHRRAPASAPRLAGVVERSGGGAHDFQVLLRLDEPTPGIGHIYALDCGSTVVVMRLFLFGEGAAAAAARDEPSWNAWLDQRFAGVGSAM